MDPKLSGLDPKLREAYERVMNGPTGPGGSTPPTPSQQPGQEQPQSPVQTPNPAAPISSPPPSPSPAVTPAPPPMATPSSNTSFNAGNFQTAQGTTAVKKAGGKMSTILILLGLVVLLVAYTFVWVFLFDLKIPFLPF